MKKKLIQMNKSLNKINKLYDFRRIKSKHFKIQKIVFFLFFNIFFKN